MDAKALIRNLAIPVSRVCLASILSFFPSLSVAQAVVAYPDLQVMTPTSQISIGNPTQPANILMDVHEKVFVTDFGLALAEQELLEGGNDRCGTLPYMS